MTTNRKDLARVTLEGSESGAMTFPQSPEILMEAGFDGYAVDFRRSTRTYYMPNGEATELEMQPTPTPVAESFDASTVREALREAQALVPGYTHKRLLRQSGESRLRICGLPARSTGALLRPNRRNPH
jgi:hypothetical protein